MWNLHSNCLFGREEYPGSRNSYNRPGDSYGGQGYSDDYADPPYNPEGENTEISTHDKEK